MPSLKTKQRILQAAESLFAEQGFSGTSLRELTALAGVNLAAVNYHFGSKENLITELLRQRLDELSRARTAALDQAIASNGPIPPLPEVLRAFISPALRMSQQGSPFVRVLARAYVEYSEELRLFLSKNYGELNRRFFELFSAHLDDLDEQQVFWRIEFTVGALTYTMADFGGSRRPTEVSEKQWLEARAEELVAFSVAGMTAMAQPVGVVA